MLVYYGSFEIVKYSEISKTKFTKNFLWGFYCINDCDQAYK